MVIGTLIALACRACRHHEIEAEPLMINQEQSHNKTALKQLPLLTYHIVFYMLTLFAIVDRIYGAIKYLHMTIMILVMVHSVMVCWLALLVHVTFLQKPCYQRHHHPFSVNRVVADTAVYTRYTTASTNTITQYVIEGTDSENNEWNLLFIAIMIIIVSAFLIS